MWAIPTGTSSALKKKKSGKESQYMFSHPELGSDPPIGSDRDSGRDSLIGWKNMEKWEKNTHSGPFSVTCTSTP